MSTFAMGKGLIDPRYCCCAVPLVNTGIYTVLGEHAVIGAAIGIIVLATPDVVGASFPSFGGVIFAIICFVIAGLQPIGFIGVVREKSSTFKVYTLLNGLAVVAGFVCSAALIIASALKHDTAVTACEEKFFSDTTNTSSSANSTLASEGQTLCSAFAWADIGMMGGLWVIMLIVQLYFLYLTRVYSTSQVDDHKLYHSVYNENPEAFTMSVLRSSRYNPGSTYNMPGPHADAWDTRASMDSVQDQGNQRAYHDAGYQEDYQHGQYEDAYGEPQGYPPTYSDGHGQQYPFSTPGGGYVDHPAEARMRDEEITPVANQYHEGQGVGYSGNAGVGAGAGGISRPEEAQYHPGGH
ncbi:hypothetical protein L198_00344 [Cryptococcus wingfieldii CBS 7118]|uniref:Uncharacterized protein n=1 Tax=Cryptococcus wingfieldii CBS 7118 TaxID=1295528 RepID=A0A1E3K6X8_9TREE|nr:hypothetical protein L198_00344 [Cryptococcus wingfieldii CBS 7118]ODO08613.1 hypothetical protein L198_00344 [Cryptococcus wingfieldii CBS 7118]